METTTITKSKMKVGLSHTIIPVVSATLVVVLAVSLAAAQKEDPASKKDNSIYAELAKAPQKAVARRNPLEKDPDAAVAGGKLFERHCAECHGDMAEGGRKAPSLLADQVQQATPGTLFWILTNGVVRRGMPVWSKLPEPERWQIVSYVKSLVPAGKRRDDERKPPAPPTGLQPRRALLGNPHIISTCKLRIVISAAVVLR
jgi:mono/diheme cytochrome c family protein